VKRQLQKTADPTKNSHYFVLAAPVESVGKLSKSKSDPVDREVPEKTNFARKHSQVFRRLGIDLINVAEDGSAVVHMKPEIMDQLSSRVRTLDALGAREQSRWVTIDRFELIPEEFRIDREWLDELKARKVTDAIVEFQPLLVRSEIDSLIRALVSDLHPNVGENITGTGTDFSGRQWLRGKITRESLSKISRDFYSVQSLHSPLNSLAAGSSAIRLSSDSAGSTVVDHGRLPSVGVVDTGVPAAHVILSKYRRAPGYLKPGVSNLGPHEHGCFVSSRIVFGDVDCSSGQPDPLPTGSALYYDINVSGGDPNDPAGIDDKGVVNPAMQAIVSTAPDVRVFNLSFDTRLPLNLISSVKRSEYLNTVQDLDNFIFHTDVLVVIAAGNSTPGQTPESAYPLHYNDPQWALGAWARSFNSLTCGSYVGRLTSGGLVSELGWPSPFCRVGPGLCNSPKPDFSAHGGNCDESYHDSGHGVGVLAANGIWKNRLGSSFAAPLLARECAFALQKLEEVCEGEAKPFAATAKAFLALTATPPVERSAVKRLVKLTLGRGEATSKRLYSPISSTGVMIWQGTLEDDKDVARVQVPVPSRWVKEAELPSLRIIVAWNPPVHAAVSEVWATRRVSVQLRMHPDGPAHHASKIQSHRSYPIHDRTYDLRNIPKGTSLAEGDMWLVELSYEQIAAYHPGMIFSAQQRVAFAAELFDGGPRSVSPQESLQALPAAKSMTRLTVPTVAAQYPVILRNLL
jgi:Subtilase family